MSRWPRVTGSNDPGQRAVATQSPLSVRSRPRGTGTSKAYRRRSAPSRSTSPAGPTTGGRCRALDADDRVRREPARARPSAARSAVIVVVGVSYGGSANTRSNGASAGGPPARKRPTSRATTSTARRARPSDLRGWSRIASSAARSRSTSTAERRAARQRLDRERAACPRRGRARSRRRARRARRARRTSPRARCPSSGARWSPAGATSRRPRARARDHARAPGLLTA